MTSASMASPPTSRLRFLDVVGAPLEAPTEWAPALVEVLVAPSEWEHVRLWRQGQPAALYLRVLAGNVRVLAEWPRSDPGYYRLRLEGGGESEEQTVTVHPQKISPTAYARLLEDLEARLPATIALALQRVGALAGVHLLPPGETTLAQELVRLRRAVVGTASRPGLAAVLIELARAPHQILATYEPWVQREQARRPHPAHLAQALARGHNLDTDRRPMRVLDTRVEHTADVYENRLVQAYLHQVELRLRRLVRALEIVQRAGSAGLLVEAQRMLDRLVRARRQATFLDEVSLPAHLPTRLTMVLLNRPPYRTALEGYLEFHRSAAVRLEEPALDAPLENLPRLYQVWGTLEVLLALLGVAAELGYQVSAHHLAGRDTGGVYLRILPDDEPALMLVHPSHGTVVKLIPERSYGRHGPLRSISYQQRPDVAVEVQRPDGSPQVYIFDPKYKLDSELLDADNSDGKPKKVDIDKMHAYRDAIRDATGRRMVRCAAVLYPGPAVHYAEGIEALPAHPGSAPLLAQRLREILARALDAPTAAAS